MKFLGLLAAESLGSIQVAVFRSILALIDLKSGDDQMIKIVKISNRFLNMLLWFPKIFSGICSLASAHLLNKCNLIRNHHIGLIGIIWIFVELLNKVIIIKSHEPSAANLYSLNYFPTFIQLMLALSTMILRIVDRASPVWSLIDR